MKSTVFLFIALFMSCSASVTAQKNTFLTLNFGRLNFTAKDSPYTMKLVLPSGTASISPLDIRDLKGMNVGLSYERQLYHRFSGALSLNGAIVNTTTHRIFSTRFLSGKDLQDVTFPLRRKLRAGLLQAQLCFDFLKSEKFDLKLGFGGATAWSHLEHDSYMSLFYQGGTGTVLEAYSNTTENKLKTGYFSSYTFGVELPKSLYFQFQITQHHIDNQIYTFTNLGIGFKFNGMNNYR